MARGPHGEWRPDDPIAAAIHTMRIGTGEIEETFVEDDEENAEENEKPTVRKRKRD